MAEMSYFPHRIGSMNDPRIGALIGAYGAAGYAYYFMTLEQMYQMNRGSININTRGMVESLARQIGITREEYLEFIDLCVEVLLFDPDMWSRGYIFSGGVNERVIAWKNDRSNKQKAGIASGEARRKKAEEKAEKERIDT